MEKHYFKWILAALFSAGIVTVSAQGTGETNGYHLVWQDLFDGGTLDARNWNIEVNGDGGGNRELQYYRAENVSVGIEPTSGKNCLVLTARKESFAGKPATSGRVHTQGKMYFQHGKIEASIRMPRTANGLWPAFWMLGNDLSTAGYPRCGEIDIVEMGERTGINAGTQDRYFSGACHWGETVADGSHPNYGIPSASAYSLQDDFHLFTLIWDNNSVKMYLDMDKNPNVAPYYEMNIDYSASHPADHPGNYLHKSFFVLFNLAVGGNFPQIWDINQITALHASNNYEAKLYVDFVKIYQKKTTVENESITTGLAPVQKTASQYHIYPNPATTEIRISGPDIPSLITVFNYAGQQIKTFEKTAICNISDLSNGNYLITITNGKKSPESFRFIKK
ncbi:hypothetical protein FACS1894181_05600 [Bacteroidia bacterium]|nr:hypothetical protein FACS1894181_05600 [Bacteroidia bacterium]